MWHNVVRGTPPDLPEWYLQSPYRMHFKKSKYEFNTCEIILYIYLRVTLGNYGYDVFGIESCKRFSY